MTNSAFINLTSASQQTVRGLSNWQTSTVCAEPVFAGGVEVTWWVSLGPMAETQSVYLIGAEYDPLGPGGVFNWVRSDPNMIIWQPAARLWRFQRRDYVHAVCADQVLELRGAESVALTMYF